MTRLTRWTKIFLLVAIAVTPVLAQRGGGGNQQMKPRRDNTQIFANEIREAFEQPIGSIGTNDIVTVLDTRRNHIRVRTMAGVEGWIQKNDLTALTASDRQAAAGRSFAFEAAEVIGYLDNPTPVYIIDLDDPNADPITLDRSFRDALRQNVDRETLERLAR